MSQAQLTICSDQFAEGYWQRRLPHSNFRFAGAHELARLSGSMLFLADELETPELLPHAGFDHVIFASTVFTIQELNLANQSCLRVCGWPGFYDNASWEVACAAGSDQTFWQEFLTSLQIAPVWVPDIAGFVAPQTIARLVNEAWYVLQDGVATQQDIDTAMQLGTNYPFGPLAWGNKIGLARVVQLLQKLNAATGKEEINDALVKAAHNEIIA